MASRVFGAWSSDTCGQCGEEIEPGEQVQFVDGSLVHEDCDTEIEADL